MTKKAFLRTAIVAALAASSSAYAAFTTWEITGASFADGAKVSGFFEYDSTIPNVPSVGTRVRNFDVKVQASSSDPLLTAFEWTPNNTTIEGVGDIQFRSGKTSETHRTLLLGVSSSLP